MEKNIELELRAEIPVADFEKVLAMVKAKGKLISESKRLSIMFLGTTPKGNVDLRIRITKGAQAEIVLKKGDFHTHDRIETAQEIQKDQILGLTKLFSLLDFDSKVTERENFNFDLGDGIVFAVVKAGSIAYVEIEKMSTPHDVEVNKKILNTMLIEMELNPISTKEVFDELCTRLSDISDWKFTGSPADFEKLEQQVHTY